MKRAILSILTFIFCHGTLAFALPQGQSVESGAASFNQPNTNTLIITADDKTVINFNSFNIGPQETVNFIQPNSSASVLSRVTGNTSSSILGNLFTNGVLFFVNPNGIYFGASANVNVNTLVASTLDISTNNFINQRYIFEHDPQKAYTEILNKGNIAAKNIALIASAVENKGIIMARAGSINLSSGNKATVTFDQRGLIQVEINEQTSGQVLSLEDGKPVKDAVSNSGTLEAMTVVMSAKTASDIFEYAVNQTGIVRGTGLVEENGTIRIVANKQIQVSGTLEAPQGNIKVRSDESVVIDHPLNLKGDTTVTSNTRDILIHGQITQSQGTLTLSAPQGGIYNSGLPIQAQDLILMSPTISTPTQAENLTLYRNAKDMNLSTSDNSGDLVTLTGDGLLVTYPLSTHLTLKSDNAINAQPGVIIQANTVRLIANKFGTTDQPLMILTDNTFINRLCGNLDITSSQLIGDQTLIHGPPDGFGAIIYNQETNLTLEAAEGSIRVSRNTSIPANNLTLKAKKNITSEGSLIAADTINLLADGAVTSLGALKAKKLIERGASFLVGGISEVGSADMINADNAVTYNTGNYSGTYSDAVDIIINNNAVITLIGNTTFWADSDANGTGAFIMNAGSSIVGGGYNLTIYASQASTLTSIAGVGNLTVRASKTGSNPTYTANSVLNVNNTVTITSCTLFMNSYDLVVTSIVNNGSLKGANFYVDVTGNDTNSGTSPGKALKTLKKACDTATGIGDIIYVAAGTYVETQESYLAEGVSIVGAGTATTIIKTGYASDPLIEMDSLAEGTNGNQTISGIKFDGNSLTGLSAIRIRGRSNVIIHDCTFVDFQDHGINFEGRATDGDTAPTIYATGNQFYNNTVTNCAWYYGYGRGALQIGGQEGMLIHDNIITQTTRPAGTNGYGIKFAANGYLLGIKIYNNTITIAPNANYNFPIEIWNASGMEVYGNTLQGNCDFNYMSKGSYAYSLDFHNNTTGWPTIQPGIEVGVNLEEGCSDVLIRNNYFKNLGYGIFINANTGSLVYNNIYIYNNIFNGIGNTTGSFGGTALGWDAADSTSTYNNINIWNNTAYGNNVANSNGDGFELNGVGIMTNVSIRNNIVVGFARAGIFGYMARAGSTIDTVSIENNDFYNCGNSNAPLFSGITPTHVTNQNNITTNPLFISTTDFHLQAGSPCINKGIVLSNVTTDYDNNVRPNGGIYDIGGYEYYSNIITTLTITGLNANNRVYDGLTDVTVNFGGATLVGILGSDVVYLNFASATASFINKNVGNGKTVTISGLTLSGPDASKYTLTQPTTTANITARPLTVSATGVNKVYDGLTTGSVTLADNRIAGDVLTTSYSSAAFSDKNVASNKTVSVSGISLAGTDAANYTVNSTASTTANITARPITVTAVASSKVYDATTISSGVPTITSGSLASGDSVTWSESFTNKNVGSANKTLVPTGTVSDGNSGNNYSVTFVNNTAGTITPATLTITGITANNKVYDATTSAAVNFGSAALAGILASDSVTLDTSLATASFTNKNVGTAKAVTVSGISIAGTDSANYTFNPTASTTANITARPLTVSATGVNKVYDGLTTGSVTLADNRIAGDVLTTSYSSAAFSDKNVASNKTVSVSGISLAGTDAANYTVNSTASTTANITARPITVTAVASSKVYDATTISSGVPTITSGSLASGDSVTWSESFTNKNVGSANKTLVPTGTVSDGNSGNNYSVTFVNNTAGTITPATLTITGITANNKVYDATTSAAVNFGSAALAGILASDSVTLDTSLATASFTNKNVGTAKAVTVSGISIAGTDSANYTFNPTASTTANITARPLTVSATGVNKVYDGLTTGSVTLADNRIAGDVLTTSYSSAAFSDKNVASNKTVSVSGISLAGTDAANYTVNSTASTTANITARPITVTAVASSKVYDATTISSGVPTITSGSLASGDSVTWSESFTNKNVGSANKTLVPTGTVSDGNSGNNYSVTFVNNTAGTITPATLTITGITANNKVYDATTSAAVNFGSAALAGILASDSVTLDTSLATASFTNKNVGTAKAVTVSGISIAGTDSANYTFNPTASTTANITARPLTVSATGVNKVYDGLTTGSVTLADNRIAGDVLTTSYSSAAFSDKNVASNKTVSVSGISLAGTDAANYTVNSTASTTANITARPITVTAVASSKVYDATTISSGVPTITSGSLASGDSVTWSESFTNKNVGSANKTLVPTGTVSDGNSGNNYSVTFVNNTAGTITPATLTITGITANNKVYDATTSAAVNFGSAALAGILASDSVTLDTSLATASFTNKNVGTAKAVTVSGISIAGTDSANYTFNPTASTTANITARPLTVSATGVNKVYDGLTTGSVTLADNRIAGDVLTTSYSSAAFSDKNVASNKTVSVSGISLAGTDAANYTVNSTASTTANITARPITVTAVASSKVYDATTISSGVPTITSGSLASGDSVTWSESFTNKNVGSANKTLVPTGTVSDGNSGNNYSVTFVNNTAGTITPATLTITGITANNKVYDATTSAAVNFGSAALAGILASDSVTLDTSLATASFTNKNVGTAKAVTVSGISIAGTDSANYTFNPTASTTANITARPLTVSATGVNKVYDGLTTGSVTLADNRIAGDVLTTSYSSAAFSDKNVASNKTVSVSGISLAGTDAANYTVNSTASTTANITARPITVTAVASSKVYDATTISSGVPTITSGSLASGDSVTWSESFTNKNVGSANKTLVPTGTVSDGNSGNNYSVTFVNNTAGTITPATLTITGITANNKVYDATTSAAVNFGSAALAGILASDSVTLDTSLATASFTNKNVGTAKAVTVSGISIAGTDSANYTFNPTASTTANITARPLTVSATGVNKVYDGLTTGSVTLADNRIAGDVLTTSYSSAAFSDKNVASNKTVSVSGISLAGTDAANYTVNSTASTTANITARPITVTAVASSKVYDATTISSGVPTITSGSLASGDSVTWSESFTNKNVGSANKTLVPTGTVSDGNSGNNYSVTFVNNTAGTITPATLTITGITANNKVYDATTSAAVNFGSAALAGILASDSVTLDTSLATASFTNKNVGTAKAVTVSGISIAGTDSANYTFNPTASTTANITARPLTVSATGVNKVYDGLTTGSVTLADNRIAGDVLTTSYSSAAFSDKNVASNKTVSVSGISLAGTDAANYTVNSTASTTANITARPITVTAVASSKVYDATTISSGVPTITSGSLASGDSVTWSESFTNKNVGSANKTLVPTGTVSDGNSGNNYSVTFVNNTAGTITPATLTITGITANNKVYDATTSAAVNFGSAALAGILASDSVTLDTSLATASFTNKNVGTAKAVTVSGISIAGTDSANYTFNPTASTTANITARPLTVSATGVNKVYDGLTTGSVTLADNRIAGDVLTTSYSSAAFSDKNVASNKTVSVSGISLAGTDAANYTVNSTASTTANITARPITVTAVASSKVYDATTISSGVPTITSGSLASGDSVTWSESFTNKNVGSANKTLVPTGTVSDGNSGNNYSVTFVNNTAGTITPATLTITGITANNKVYDATTSAAVNFGSAALAGILASDSVTLDTSLATASFTNKNVGTAKAVTVSGISIAGTDSANYTFNPTASTTANITARPLTVSATGVNKVYDGLTTGSVTLADNRIAGDVLTTSYSSAAFSDKNVASNKTVSVSGISLAGTDAANYTVNSTASTTANITARPLTVTAAGVDKVYDDTTDATVILSDNRIPGDILTTSYASATFTNKNVGTAKTVTVSGINISGTDASNYSVNATASTSTTITPATLTITGITANNKVYDATTSAAVNFGSAALAGILASDSVTLDTSLATASFTNKNVGTAKAVSVSGISISGAEAANYTLNTTAQTDANITARPLTISATGVDKVYDGTTAATATLSDDRIAGDILTASYTLATFSDKNLAKGIAVSVSDISISGADSGNYTLVNDTATTTADIVEPPVAPSVVFSPFIQPLVIDLSLVKYSIIEPSVAEPSVVDPLHIELSVTEPSAVQQPVVESPLVESSVVEPAVTEPSAVKQPVASLSNPGTGHTTVKTRKKANTSIYSQNHLHKQRILRVMRPYDVKQPAKSGTSLSHPWAGAKTQKIRDRLNISTLLQNRNILLKLNGLLNEQKIIKAMHPLFVLMAKLYSF